MDEFLSFVNYKNAGHKWSKDIRRITKTEEKNVIELLFFKRSLSQTEHNNILTSIVQLYLVRISHMLRHNLADVAWTVICKSSSLSFD